MNNNFIKGEYLLIRIIKEGKKWIKLINKSSILEEAIKRVLLIEYKI